MDKNMDMNNFGFSPYGNYDMRYDQMMDEGNMFNPIIQYEQAYMYYRYLTQQLEYKIKCKEYEKLCGKQENYRGERKVE